MGGSKYLIGLKLVFVCSANIFFLFSCCSDWLLLLPGLFTSLPRSLPFYSPSSGWLPLSSYHILSLSPATTHSLSLSLPLFWWCLYPAVVVMTNALRIGKSSWHNWKETRLSFSDLFISITSFVVWHIRFFLFVAFFVAAPGTSMQG